MNDRQRKYYLEGHRQGIAQRGGNWTPLLRDTLSKALGVPEDEAVRLTLESYRRRLDALPSTAWHPELAGMRECVTAMNQGIAAGADVPVEHVQLRANFLFMMTDSLRFKSAGSAAAPPAEPGCTLVYFPESERGPLLANNQDGLASSMHQQTPEQIVGNKAGLLIGTVSSGLMNDEVSPELFPAPVFLMVYEQCQSTAEAVELMTRLNLFWGPCNALIADQQGQAAVIEKSTCRYGLHRSPDGFAATTEMAAQEPAYKRYLWSTRISSLADRGLDESSVDWAYWKTCERRSTRLGQLLDEARRSPTFAAMESIIYDHTGEPEQIHMDGTPCHPEQKPGETEWSLRTTIWVLREHAAQYSFAAPPRSSRDTPRKWVNVPAGDWVF